MQLQPSTLATCQSTLMEVQLGHFVSDAHSPQHLGWGSFIQMSPLGAFLLSILKQLSSFVRSKSGPFLDHTNTMSPFPLTLMLWIATASSNSLRHGQTSTQIESLFLIFLHKLGLVHFLAARLRPGLRPWAILSSSSTSQLVSDGPLRLRPRLLIARDLGTNHRVTTSVLRRKMKESSPRCSEKSKGAALEAASQQTHHGLSKQHTLKEIKL